MLIIYSPIHKDHNPLHEFYDGYLVPYHETPERADIIYSALENAGIGSYIEPIHFELDPIVAVHTADYLYYLEHIYERWVAAGGSLEGVMPSTLAHRHLDRYCSNPLAEPGYYCFDLSAVIVEGTYRAACASVDLALTGAKLLLEGKVVAYALCRPPGHHAGRELYGGYCFLNNAAIAANYLGEQTGSQVAILDIDFHHGNGTQDIFYERSDVLCISIHADPARHYPYFLGYADERGKGEGEGYNYNFPLEADIDDKDFLEVLIEALAIIEKYAPEWLVVSVGFDTFKDDPLADFALTTQGYRQIGAQIAQLGLPTLFVQEGGYAVAALGENVVAFLQGFEETRI